MNAAIPAASRSGRINAATLGGLTGSRNLALTDAYSGERRGLDGRQQQRQTTYSGVLSGSGSLTKIGSGTLTLSGANTYTGTTTVSAGTLTVNGSTATSSGVSVASDATLAGSGSIGGAVSVAAGATLAPGTCWHGGNAYAWQHPLVGRRGVAGLRPGRH